MDDRFGAGGSSRKPAVSISDIGLPDGTGMDFLEALRKEAATPAIALSGFGMEADIVRSKQAGFMMHLTKPINLEKLELAIRETMGGSR